MSSDDKKSTKLIGEPVFDSINGAPTRNMLPQTPPKAPPKSPTKPSES